MGSLMGFLTMLLQLVHIMFHSPSSNWVLLHHAPIYLFII